MDKSVIVVAILSLLLGFGSIYLAPRGIMNIVSLIQRANSGKNLSPAERAVLRFVKMLAIVFALAAWPILQNAMQNGTLHGQWQDVLRNAGIAGASAVIASLWKYVSARADIKKGITVGGVTVPLSVVAQEANQLLNQAPPQIQRDAALLGITQNLEAAQQIPVAPAALANADIVQKVVVGPGASFGLLSPTDVANLSQQVTDAMTQAALPAGVYFHPVSMPSDLPLGSHSTDGLGSAVGDGTVSPVTNGQTSDASNDAGVTPIVVPSPAQAEGQAVETGSTPNADPLGGL